MVKDAWGKELFGHHFIDCLVLDEASQMNLPEAIMAALPLRPAGQVIVVGDHRQMPPIVKHDWDNEPRRTFQEFRAHASLYEAIRALDPPLIQFAESFRLHAVMAEFLRQEIYRHDGIDYFSRRHDGLPEQQYGDAFVAAVLHPEYPLVVVVHDETNSQMRNEYEQALITPVIAALSDPAGHGLQAKEGLGVVVPHRAQRAALQTAFPSLSLFGDDGVTVRGSAIDTVERFQGGERTVILVSATESNRAYLLAASDFLLDPRRLTVALSRAKRKLILVASRSIIELFSADEETFANSQLWKNLLRRTCTTCLLDGQCDGRRVIVWGAGVS
jgi:superfamily I DNA and/or RNA helicase